ncbi:hypothetical protein CLM65_11150 [Serratia marcescens]|uniref:hypothetical protein n=1 Tax=Serratia marcescens TaxID=615 RepID=UPI000A16FA18|nr:hypothetical protein [Serratia marcescens]EIJ6702009.1 hypothetical protein [Serratia marcescens]EIV5186763.1 hypothetical protein [Serratia marcescens]EIY2711315.1 hypothetical protein [Serratia marcescens]KAB1980950.1 hypothetical protein F8B69_17490 [Serratia marcescens]OSB79011.1 hypothetical protein B7R52_01080 [Serratia marcescens]
MLELNTLLTNDTIIGACIGAAAAIAGSTITAIATYFINKYIDRAKLIIDKKEELYIACDAISKCILVCESSVKKGRFDSALKSTVNEIMELQTKIRMLIGLYFANLEDSKDIFDVAMDNLTNKCLIPSGESSIAGEENYSAVGIDYCKIALRAALTLRNDLRD